MRPNPDLAAQLDAIDRDLAARLIAALHCPELATLPGRVPLAQPESESR
ncbi:MAG: hypothetical protein JXQ79_06040 [Rhodobacteraceae bacterium]|nr:hypothetical protein [Paracoccaceae bacterium]